MSGKELEKTEGSLESASASGMADQASSSGATKIVTEDCQGESAKKDDVKVDDVGPETGEEEDGVTMVDVLQDEQDLEEDAKAVLGAADDKNCTYDQGT